MNIIKTLAIIGLVSVTCQAMANEYQPPQYVRPEYRQTYPQQYHQQQFETLRDSRGYSERPQYQNQQYDSVTTCVPIYGTGGMSCTTR